MTTNIRKSKMLLPVLLAVGLLVATGAAVAVLYWQSGIIDHSVTLSVYGMEGELIQIEPWDAHTATLAASYTAPTPSTVLTPYSNGFSWNEGALLVIKDSYTPEDKDVIIDIDLVMSTTSSAITPEELDNIIVTCIGRPVSLWYDDEGAAASGELRQFLPVDKTAVGCSVASSEPGYEYAACIPVTWDSVVNGVVHGQVTIPYADVHHFMWDEMLPHYWNAEFAVEGGDPGTGGIWNGNSLYLEFSFEVPTGLGGLGKEYGDDIPIDVDVQVSLSYDM